MAISTIDDLPIPDKASEVNASSPASIDSYVASQELHRDRLSDTVIPQINTVTGEIDLIAIQIDADASSASQSKTNAENSETASALSETNAGNSATEALNAQLAAESALDSFDDRYLGAKSSDPTLDNDGNPLIDGAMYWNTVTKLNRFYDLEFTAWVEDGFTPTNHSSLSNRSAIDSHPISSITGLEEAIAINYKTKTANYTAVHKDFLKCDTLTTGAFTVTLPLTPTENDKVEFMDVKGNFSTANLTIGRNGENIMGLAEDMIVDTDNISFGLIFTNNDWRLV